MSDPMSAGGESEEEDETYASDLEDDPAAGTSTFAQHALVSDVKEAT